MARRLLELGVHKQITNRLLEPFMWHTVICTATEWENFFNLRCHPMAQPEIRRIAEMMRQAYNESFPTPTVYGQWHLPLIDWDDHVDQNIAEDDLPWVSAGRCARVSYLTHDGKRDPQADIDLAKRLQVSGHMSPFEHVAMPFNSTDMRIVRDLDNQAAQWVGSDVRHSFVSRMRDSLEFDGNLRGWHQLRKALPNEAVFRG